jgi:preprotein translocase subunit SecD
MSSDYIPRLRDELVRAAELRPSRRRVRRFVPALRPLVAAAAVALVAVAVVVAVDRGSGADELEYTVGSGASEQAADVMRERLSAAGVSDASVSVGSDGRLAISAPPESRAAVATLTQPGEFAIYDWEASVLGPDGEPAPGDPSVTGGDNAGNHALTSKPQAETRAAAASDGGRVVRALGGSERWYALGGEPALTSDDIASAMPITDPATNDPAVALEFTEPGQTAFHTLTRQIAQRGADVREWQHFVMVIDDRIVSVPFIDYRQEPDGIDGAGGGQISGGLTAQTARWIAAMLASGPLPAELLPASGG